MLTRYFFSFSVTAALLLLAGCQGDPVEATFFTEGSCVQCRDLIISTLEAEEGVASARWDFESSLTTVAYYPGEVEPDSLQKALADAGFRTGFYEPNLDARAELPECCQKRIERRLKQRLPTGH
jgi:copper chaperone CopZ